MNGKTILYRGSLKSCNYHCSYCPFSKHRSSAEELEKDRKHWLSFVQSFIRSASSLGITALMVVPYGEALIHPWYWLGLARISMCPDVDAAGIQTNLSFPIEKSLAYFDQNGGDRRKLRLWATFHPEMTTPEAFAGKCARLVQSGITLCAGAVGVPENIRLIQSLREKLPENIYLWVNQMDGLKRPYTREEQAAFLNIDPYFLRELAAIPADNSQCRERLFIEGSENIRTCNISSALDTAQASWKTLCIHKHFPEPQCGRKLCSCYLAYGGRSDFMNQILFGPYPLFRIPRRPKAVFFDIEGTLLQEQGGHTDRMYIPEHILAGIKALSLEKIPMFFATTLPYPEARKRCPKIWNLFSGGIFAGGAHLTLEQENIEEFFYLPDSLFQKLLRLKQQFHFRVLAYRQREKLYKITLLRPTRSPWDKENISALADAVPGMHSNEIRYFLEKNCLQIVSSHASKANGVRTLCSWCGILPEETAAAGDSAEDAEMLALCNKI